LFDRTTAGHDCGVSAGQRNIQERRAHDDDDDDGVDDKSLRHQHRVGVELFHGSGAVVQISGDKNGRDDRAEERALDGGRLP